MIISHRGTSRSQFTRVSHAQNSLETWFVLVPRKCTLMRLSSLLEHRWACVLVVTSSATSSTTRWSCTTSTVSAVTVGRRPRAVRASLTLTRHHAARATRATTTTTTTSGVSAGVTAHTTPCTTPRWSSAQLVRTGSMRAASNVVSLFVLSSSSPCLVLIFGV